MKISCETLRYFPAEWSRLLLEKSNIAIIAKLALALLIGSLGGWVFTSLRMPLPWMLGPMVFCLVAAVFRLPVATPKVIRPPMTATIGVLLGSSFTPEIIATLPVWISATAGLMLFLATAAVICVFYFWKIARFDLRTSYFCGMPGGVVEMLMLGEHYGANTRSIALVHATRNLLIIFSLPFIIQILSNADLTRANVVTAAQDSAEMLSSIAWLATTAAAGLLAGRLLRLPAQALLGPMLISAIVHALGLTDFKPPPEIVVIAQLVLGTIIGCRFAGAKAMEIGRIMFLSLGSTLILLGFTLLFALLLASLSPFSLVSLLLAYSPGGLAEMGLLAILLHVEVAFVTSHHIFRVILVTSSAGLISRFIFKEE